MRNQQIKKVNRIFFSSQVEEKQKWLEQMADEGWQLISESSFIYSFQRIASEQIEKQSSYKAMLAKDFQGSMPLFQDSKTDWLPLLVEKNFEWKNPQYPMVPVSNVPQSDRNTKNRRILLGTLAILLFMIASFTKIAIISSGDVLSLFRWQFFTGILVVGSSLVLGMIVIFRSFVKFVSIECKTKK